MGRPIFGSKAELESYRERARKKEEASKKLKSREVTDEFTKMFGEEEFKTVIIVDSKGHYKKKKLMSRYFG